MASNCDQYDASAALKRLSKADTTVINSVASDERLRLQTYGITLPFCVPDSGTAPGKCDSTAIGILNKLQPSLLDEHIPLEVTGDGNCLFRAVSRALYHTEAHHMILRLLTALEIVENVIYYDSHLKNYKDLVKDFRIPNEPYTSILHRACTVKAFSYMQHLFALSTVIGETIQSYHPNSMNMHHSAFTRRVAGRNVKEQPSHVKLLWSAMSVPKKASDYNANHFVFLYSTAQPDSHIDIIDIESDSDDGEVTSLLVSKKNYKRKIPKSPPRPCKKHKSYTTDFCPLRMDNFDSATEMTTPPHPMSTVPAPIPDKDILQTSLSSPVSVTDTAAVPSGFQIESRKFLNIHELYPILCHPSEVMSNVPRGVKENQYFIIDNQPNYDRRQKGHASQFSDDCGPWQSGGPSSKTLFLVDNDSKLRNIFDKKKQGLGYCVSKTVNKKIQYMTLEMQPDEKDIIYVRRNYTTLKTNKSNKRRITWIENSCNAPKVAIYEYLGKFPSLE